MLQQRVAVGFIGQTETVTAGEAQETNVLVFLADLDECHGVEIYNFARGQLYELHMSSSMHAWQSCKEAYPLLHRRQFQSRA